MTQAFYIGVDGGATKCVVRVEDAAGKLLGSGKGGPANIRLSVEKTWDAILDALQQAIKPAGISLGDSSYAFHVGMGLAGCESVKAYEAFMRFEHPFTSLQVVSDAHTACLGAHGGKDGEIIIIGTGVIGYQSYAGKSKRVSGFGFPHDDEGGGAWLGLQAVREAFQAYDGRMAESGLSKAVYAYFNESWDDLISWANQANSTAFASLAPLVIEQSMQGDAKAITILKRAAAAIESVAATLSQGTKTKTPLSCALVGGVASFVQPYLSADLKKRITSAQASPDVGAVMLTRLALEQAR